MKYLFFDVECSNCRHGVGKICEYGYVLTDESFNILKQDDIPMSPGRGEENYFYLKGRKYEKDLELSYEYDYYLSCPEFPHFYKQIKELMEDKDTLCFAYSMENDIRHISNTCRRYHLDSINYTCYDIQALAGKYLEQDKRISLFNACTKIVGPSSTVKLQEHLSRDDAKMEMMIFEAICELSKKQSVELLNGPNITRVNSVEFIANRIATNKRKRQKAKGHDLYRSLLTDNDEIVNNPDLVGRRYNFSGELKCHYDELVKAIDHVKELNGVFCNNLSKTDFFVTYDEANKEELKTRFSKPFEGKMITYEELMNLKKG